VNAIIVHATESTYIPRHQAARPKANPPQIDVRLRSKKIETIARIGAKAAHRLEDTPDFMENTLHVNKVFNDVLCTGVIENPRIEGQVLSDSLC
jgi:hypothetical protein